MTSSLSGFLAPEERAVSRRRAAIGAGLVEPVAPGVADAADLPRAILTALDGGPMTLNELIAEVHDSLHASPRAILSTIDDLKPSRLVKTSFQGSEEVLDLTEAGHRLINP